LIGLSKGHKKKHLYSEKEAATIFYQMMSAICYCHNQNICHRDLKPENLLLLNNEEDSPIKVIDFGLSKIFTKENNKMSTKVGTAYYVSPEVLKGDYTEKCDIWSAGVILYILLCGEPPFNGKNDNEIYKKILEKKLTFSQNEWKQISYEAKELISKMVCSPEKRLTAQDVLKHHWVENRAAIPNNALVINLDSFKNFKDMNKLKIGVLTFIATRLKEDEIENLKNIFISLDKNGDGVLSFDEIKEGLSKLNLSANELEEIFKSVDTDKNGFINYSEFLASTIDKKIYLKEEKLYDAFRAFDKDNSGKLSKTEVKEILKIEEEDQKIIDDLVDKYDTNNDGEIDYNEFLQMMTKI